MCKKNKNEANFNNIKFAFDMQKEKIIYKNLSFYNLSRSEKKKLSANMKFDSYMMWKNYIREKYSEHSVEYLEEFTRYLNHKIRRSNSFNSYWGLLIPVMITLLLNKFTEIYVDAMNIKFNYGPEPLKDMLIVWLFYIVITVVVFTTAFALIKQIINPTIDNEIENNLLIDYKEIIEEIIDEKQVI